MLIFSVVTNTSGFQNRQTFRNREHAEAFYESEKRQIGPEVELWVTDDETGGSDLLRW